MLLRPCLLSQLAGFRFSHHHRLNVHRYTSRFMSSTSETSSDVEDEFERAAQLIANDHARRIIVLTGAGISTASGIPDFRTPGTGLYDNLSRYNLPWPEAVFDLIYFHSNPLPFYTLAKELYPTGRYQPNIAHHFVRLLYDKSRLLRIYTQNIDSLERMAGIPLEKLVEAHGTFLSATCTVCGVKVSPKLVKDAIYQGKVAKCPECHDLVKPDIVFFGEDLPERFWEYRKDLAQTDLAIIMGTSLEVYPFAAVADDIPRAVPRILINRELVGSFRYQSRPSDVVLLGSITDSVQRLSDILGWHEDLARLMANWKLNNVGQNHTNGCAVQKNDRGSRRHLHTLLRTRPTSLTQLSARVRSMELSESPRTGTTSLSEKLPLVTQPERRSSAVITQSGKWFPAQSTLFPVKPISERDSTQPTRSVRKIILTDSGTRLPSRLNALRQYLYPCSSSSSDESESCSTD